MTALDPADLPEEPAAQRAMRLEQLVPRDHPLRPVVSRYWVWPG